MMTWWTSSGLAIMRQVASMVSVPAVAKPMDPRAKSLSRMLNWVTVGGIMSELDLQYEQIDYVPVYRSAAGTGGGWGFVRWTRA